MKIVFKSAVLLLAMSVSLDSVFAQDEKEKTKEKPGGDLIIRKKGGSNEKMTIVIDGDKVTVNGKPVDEYKSDELDIIKGGDFNWKMPDGAFALAAPHADMWSPMGDDFVKEIHSNKAFLGVMTKKADKGAEITEVTDESAAEKAGLKEGDVITKVNDAKIEDADDLYKEIGKYKPSDKVKVSFLRGGKENTVEAVLSENKQVRMFSWKNGGNDNFSFTTPMPPGRAWGMGDDFWSDKPRLGIQVQDTEDGKGVKVLDVDDEEAGGKAGLEEDDIITTFNGKNVTSVDDIKTNMKNVKKGESVTVGYKRDGVAKTVTIKFPKDLKTTDL